MENLSVTPSLATTAAGSLSKTDSANQQVSESTIFQELLSYMLLSSLGSGSDQTSNMLGMLFPQLLLMEQLQAQQVSTDTQADPAAAARFSSLSTAYTQSAAPASQYPVQAPLTQGFHPGHNGLDFGVVVGTPIHATISGKVTYAGWNNEGYGNLVIVDNGTYKTYFAHLSEIPVTLGQSIQKGAVVGLSGNTGNSTGPHLHYEVRKNNVVIDPSKFDPSGL